MSDEMEEAAGGERHHSLSAAEEMPMHTPPIRELRRPEESMNTIIFWVSRHTHSFRDFGLWVRIKNLSCSSPVWWVLPSSPPL